VFIRVIVTAVEKFFGVEENPRFSEPQNPQKIVDFLGS